MTCEPESLRAPHNVTMLRSTKDVPAIPTLPAPLTVQYARPDHASTLASLLGRAYPTEQWDANNTENELFHDESIKAVLLVTTEKSVLATASLQVRADNPNYGQLRWVATRADRRREGLASALVINVLAIAKQADCDQLGLKTTTDLSGAIALYLQLGFEPQVRDDSDRQIWKRYYKYLANPDE